MKFLTMLAMSSLVGLGCSKAKDSGGAPSAAPPAAAPAAAAPAAPAPTPPPPAPAADVVAAPGKPLSDHLGAAVAATVYAIKVQPGGAEKTKTQGLDEAATKAYLGRLDLAQRADGPVAKCPDDTVVEFTDAGGTLLGTIGFCGPTAARFTGADGKTGGIRATAP